MKQFTRTVAIACLLVAMTGLYASSRVGLGVQRLHNPQVMNQLAKDCPDYRKDVNGNCIRSSFRSLYVANRMGSGSFSGGK